MQTALPSLSESATTAPPRAPGLRETSSQWIWMDGGIVRAKLKPYRVLTLDDAREAVHVIRSVCGGVRRPVLVDMTELEAMAREARVFFAGPGTAEVESAAALLIRSPLTRAIGNFFMGLNRPLFPTRLFTSEPEALAWLEEVRSP